MEKSYAQHYALLEGEHWWFRARRLILRDLLVRLKWPPQPKILEIGVGPGYNLLEIYPSGARLEGVEPDCALASLAAARGSMPVFNASIDELPSEIQEGSYDGVTMFDVLEHIPDDARALQIVNRKLKHGGRIILSVPAYTWLGGQQDIVNQHCRRYTLSELRRKLQTAHFTLERMTYFNTFLFVRNRRSPVDCTQPSNIQTNLRETSSISASHQTLCYLLFLAQNAFSCGFWIFHSVFRPSQWR